VELIKYVDENGVGVVNFENVVIGFKKLGLNLSY
jgi:hypothetical protein